MKQKSHKKLNDRQKLFCKYYSMYGYETFGNATKSYAKAYNKDLSKKNIYNAAKNKGALLRKKPNIQAFISDLFIRSGITPEFVNAELKFCIMQNKCLVTKIKAISIYFKYKDTIQDIELRRKKKEMQALEEA